MSQGPQVTRFLPGAQTAQDTLRTADPAPPDTSAFRLTDPVTSATDFLYEMRERLGDADLWLGLFGILLQVILILGLAVIMMRLVDRVTDRWTKRFEHLPPLHPGRQRAYTISNLLSSTARYVVWPIAVIMLLSAVNVDVAALIATAGIAGLAIGFGAQTFVKDVISGIFLLFDDTIHVGDLVRINGENGTVEHIGVRLIKVRKFDGELMMVPAGELRVFGNRSIGFARVVVLIGLSYEQDIETVLPVMKRVADEWAADRKEILLEEEPQVQSILEFGDSAVTARIVVQVKPGEQFAAEREIRMLVKREFDRLGIEIPFPRRTVYMREEKDTPPRSIPDVGPSTAAEAEPAGSD